MVLMIDLCARMSISSRLYLRWGEQPPLGVAPHPVELALVHDDHVGGVAEVEQLVGLKAGDPEGQWLNT